MKTKNKTEYKTEFCEMLIEHCKAGHDIQSFSAVINVSRATLYRWLDKHEEFKQAHEIGKEACRMRVIKRLQDFADGKMPRGANVVAAIFLAKVYGFRDDGKQEDNKNNEIKMSYDPLNIPEPTE